MPSTKYTVTGTNETKTIKSGGKFTLKDGQIAEIVGLPAGSAYTITEESLPTGYAQTSITRDGKGTVTAGTAQEVTVTNTYNPAPITVDPEDPNSNYPFKGEKILTGRDWKERDKFEFSLVAIDGAPLREGVPGTYIPAKAEYTEGGITDDGAHVPFNFGSITFTKPGKYVYNITEYIPTNYQDKIAGVSYDGSFYRVTVTITDDGSGQLQMGTPVIEHILGNGTTENAEIATFTNTFKDDTETLVIEATKVYKDAEREPMALTYGQFQFELKPATENEDKKRWITTPTSPA